MKTRSVLAILTTTILVAGCAKPITSDIQTETGAAVTVTTQEIIPTAVQETTPTQEVIALPTYTLTDIATHNSAQSCWTVIKGNVYDMTAFIKQHPGGERGILKTCGKDGTQDFLGAHSRGPAEKSLENFIIGTLTQ